MDYILSIVVDILRVVGYGWIWLCIYFYAIRVAVITFPESMLIEFVLINSKFKYNVFAEIIVTI